MGRTGRDLIAGFLEEAVSSALRTKAVSDADTAAGKNSFKLGFKYSNALSLWSFSLWGKVYFADFFGRFTGWRKVEIRPRTAANTAWSLGYLARFPPEGRDRLEI